MQPGEDDGIPANDGTGDMYAEWPGDSGIDFSNVSFPGDYEICMHISYHPGPSCLKVG